MLGDATFDEADLNGYADGRLDASRAAELAESIAGDPAARSRLDAWRRQNESLRIMFASVLAEPVPVRLVPRAMPKRDAGPARRAAPAADRRPFAAALAVASVGLGLVGFALGVVAGVGTDGFGLGSTPWRGLPEAASPAPFAQGLASLAEGAHRLYLADPVHAVEVAAVDEARLLRWIRHSVGPSLRIPSLAGQGWAFLGGRVVPGQRGPAAFLAYGSGADRLGLLVSQAGGPDERAPAAAEGGAAPLGVATWTDGDYGFALTSDRGPEWLGRNLGPLRDSVRAQARASDEGPIRP